MADKKITQLTNITGANLVDADEFVVVDISADETKAITLGELKVAFDSGSGFVRITGDTMTGALDVESTITAENYAHLKVTSGYSSLYFNGITNLSSRYAAIKKNYDSPFDLSINASNSSSGAPLIFNSSSATEAMRIDSSGSVGIGTSSPSAILHVSSSDPEFILTDTSTNVDHSLDGNSGTGVLRLHVDKNSEASDPAYIINMAGSEAMRIDSSGRVGIGTSSPDDALHVYNTSSLNHVRIDGPAGINRNLTLVRQVQPDGIFMQTLRQKAALILAPT